MIHLITGKPGSGKTAWCAGLMSKLIAEEPEKAKREQERHDKLDSEIKKIRAKALLYEPDNKKGWRLKRDADVLEAGVTRYEKRTVVTDLQLKGEFAKNVTLLSSHAELAALKHCYLFLDEAQLYLNARTWSAVPIEIQFLLQQHRKRNIEIFFIVQNARRMDVICRELVGRYWEAERPYRYSAVMRLLRLNRLIRITEYEAESILWTGADDAPEAVKEVKRLKTNYMWLQGQPLEEDVDLGGRFFGPFGLFNTRSRWAEDAWLAYHTRQEILLPKDAKYHGKQSAAEIGNSKKR